MTSETDSDTAMQDEQQQAAPESPVDDAKAGTDDEATKPSKKKKPSLKDQVTELEAQLAESHDKHLRLRADFDNYRKRMQRDLVDAREFSRLGTLEEILPVLDHFQMAMAYANQSADYATLKQGMDMILVEFERCFENLGVTRIVCVGEPFDPNHHEAVATEPSDEVPDGVILRETKAGYRLGDRLLRAPAVVVSSGKPEPAEDADSDEQ